MERRDCEPMASVMWALLVGSTWKVSAMQEVAISTDSLSSGVRVPSLREVERKSIMARARRFLESRVDAWKGGVRVVERGGGGGGTMMAA